MPQKKNGMESSDGLYPKRKMYVLMNNKGLYFKRPDRKYDRVPGVLTNKFSQARVFNRRSQACLAMRWWRPRLDATLYVVPCTLSLEI